MCLWFLKHFKFINVIFLNTQWVFSLIPVDRWDNWGTAMLSNLFKVTRTKMVSELREVSSLSGAVQTTSGACVTSGHHRGNLSHGVVRLEGRARNPIIGWKCWEGGQFRRFMIKGPHLQRTPEAEDTEVGCRHLCAHLTGDSQQSHWTGFPLTSGHQGQDHIQQKWQQDESLTRGPCCWDNKHQRPYRVANSSLRGVQACNEKENEASWALAF